MPSPSGSFQLCVCITGTRVRERTHVRALASLSLWGMEVNECLQCPSSYIVTSACTRAKVDHQWPRLCNFRQMQRKHFFCFFSCPWESMCVYVYVACVWHRLQSPYPACKGGYLLSEEKHVSILTVSPRTIYGAFMVGRRPRSKSAHWFYMWR